MKRFLSQSLIISLLSITTLIFPLATAYGADQLTIEGTILNANHKTVGNAVVSIDCYGTGANASEFVSASTTSDTGANKGYYHVDIPKGICKNGSNVIVTASKGSESGANSGTVVKGDALIDINLLDQISVPEFSTPFGILAFIASIAAYLYIRRKNASI